MRVRLQRRAGASTSGAVTPLAAVALALALGFAGLVNDVGVWYVRKRALQSATDAAALAAANHLDDADAVAGRFLAMNGFAADDLVSTEVGYYCPDAGLAPADRFASAPCPTGDVAAAGPDAVRVSTRAVGPVLLAKALGARTPGLGIRGAAVAARVDEVGLGVGSGLASADLPLVNGVLQSLVGGSGLSLTAVQYDGLLETQVDALSFFDALATRLGVQAGTYGDLLSAQAKVSDVFQAAVDALDAQGALVDASAAASGLAVLNSKVTGSPSIQLGALFDLGVWKDVPLGSSAGAAALAAGLNAFQLASFVLQLSGQQHTVAVPTASFGIPGLLGATVAASAIEPPQHAYFAFGPKGVAVNTAQVRVSLTLSVGGGLSQVPLYVEVAQGHAEVSALDCGADPATDAWAQVEATPGLATLYLGTPPAGAVSGFGSATRYADIGYANLVSILGTQVKGKAVAAATPPQPTTLTFLRPPDGWTPPVRAALTTQGYIGKVATVSSPSASQGWPAEAVSTDVLSGLGARLWSSLSLKACQFSCAVEVPVPSAATNVLALTLNPLLSGIDPLIDGILSSLGVKLGRAEVLVTGVRCGVPVLIV